MALGEQVSRGCGRGVRVRVLRWLRGDDELRSTPPSAIQEPSAAPESGQAEKARIEGARSVGRCPPLAARRSMGGERGG
jgi:hypothetical protein